MTSLQPVKHYIDTATGRLHGFWLNGEQDHLITPTMVPATDEQVYAIQNPPEMVLARKDGERILKIVNTDPLVIRHRDEVDEGVATTMTPADYLQLLTYRRALREMPSQSGWPDIPYPDPPPFL